MKQFISFITILLFAVNLLSAQEINNKQWTLIHERTATWCPLCGSWGWDFKDKILNEFKNDNVVYMAVNYSGDLVNETATAFDSKFGGVGQPIFFVDNTDIKVNSSNGDSKLQETRWEVDFKKDLPPYQGIGIEASMDDDLPGTINAKAIVEFLDDPGSGEFYFSLLLLEDVMNAQASRTGLQLHKNVLRNSFLPTVFDNYIASGPIAKGTKFEFSGKIENLSGEAKDYKVLGIVWGKANNQYLFNNCFISDVKLLSSTNDEILDNSFYTYQAESGSIVVQLDKKLVLQRGAEITVSDLSGRIINRTTIQNGQNSIQIQASYNPGVHIVTLTNGKDILSKKITLL